jgi:hypothetical protein
MDRQTEIDTIAEYIVALTGCAVPTKQIKIPPKHYYSAAVLYFKEVKNGKAKRPDDIKSEEDLEDCIKNSMAKFLMYEKCLQDMVQQGYTPIVNQNDNFWVAGWNCLEVPSI